MVDDAAVTTLKVRLGKLNPIVNDLVETAGSSPTATFREKQRQSLPSSQWPIVCHGDLVLPARDGGPAGSIGLHQLSALRPGPRWSKTLKSDEFRGCVLPPRAIAMLIPRVSVTSAIVSGCHPITRAVYGIMMTFNHLPWEATGY